jgi:penicillin-binding protein 2
VPHESGRITTVTQSDLDLVKRAMVAVTSNPSGTAYQVFRNAPYVVGGKTGTAQVFSLQGQKYHGGALAEHLRDHSLFIAFAPADHPQIAVALIVENGGWGASVAAPIVRSVLDYYLLQRNKPGVLQAAVATAASATQAASEPAIGQTTAAQPASAVTPVTVAPGFKPLPLPEVPASATAAPAPSAAVSQPVSQPAPPQPAPTPPKPHTGSDEALAPARDNRAVRTSGTASAMPASAGADD